MTTYFSKSYGAYAYNDMRDGLGKLKNTLGYRHRQSKSLSRDGAFAVNSLQDPRRLSFEGILTGAGNAQDAASLRAAADAFAAAHAAGQARPLSIDSDRYINAQVETFEDDFNGLSHQYTLTFWCFDPYWYAQVSTLQALTVGGSVIVTPTGAVKSLPVFTLIAGGAGGLVTVANAQDASFSFSPPAPGTFTLDCLQESLTDSNGIDQIAGFTGDFPALLAQANTLTVTTSGGAQISSVTCGWQDRWL